MSETILKRRKRQAENRALRSKEALKSKVRMVLDPKELGKYENFPLCSSVQVVRKAKRELFKRAEKFAKEYQDKERNEIRFSQIDVL